MSNSQQPGLIVICGPTATGKSGLALALAQRLGSSILSADSRQVYRDFDIGTAKPTVAEQQLVPHYLIDICDPRETLTVADYQQQAQALITRLHQQTPPNPPLPRGGESLTLPPMLGGESLTLPPMLGGESLTLSPMLGGESLTLSPMLGGESLTLPPMLGGESPSLSPMPGEGESPSLPPLSGGESLSVPPLARGGRGGWPLLVGGTGLYIRSIVQGMKIPRVAPQPELRSQLASLGQTQLYPMLQQVDPAAAQKIHPNDPVRTLRALEVYYVTGRPISEHQGENPPDYPILQIGLDCADADALTHRIEQRTEQMLAAGWLAEVELLGNKYRWDLPLLDTLGYGEMKQYLAGEISLSEAKKLTVLHTRQFAKRQRTWFRAYPQIEWFDTDNPDLLEEVWQRVQEFIQQSYAGL